MTRWAAALLLLFATDAASAACVNKFVQRRDTPGRWAVTLLTGHFTFQEAQTLARDIAAGRAAPLMWVDDRGKPLGKQFGELKVVRPMPVACEGKPSGSVILVTFLAPRPPSAKIAVKFGAKSVEFDEQK